MLRYRTAFAVGLFALVVIASPALARDLRAELAKTDAAESWATIQRNLAGFARWTLGARSDATPGVPATGQSMSLADFAGSRWGHGRQLTVQPDGIGHASSRTYQWCSDPGVTTPCDTIRDGEIVPGATLDFAIERIEGRTAYGSVLARNAVPQWPRQAVALTLGEYGVATLSESASAPSSSLDPTRGTMFCGRSYEDMPAWLVGQHPCGA